MRVLEIDLGQIYNNLKRIYKITSKPLLLVLKNNAYGIGLKEILEKVISRLSSHSQGEMIWGIALRDLEEAFSALRYLKISGLEGIRVISLMTEHDEERVRRALRYGIEPVVYSYELLEILSNLADELGTNLRVHLKVDTGMNRFGISWREFLDSSSRVWNFLNRFNLVSLLTHMIEGEDLALLEMQVERFNTALENIASFLGYRPLVHLYSSSPILKLLESGRDDLLNLSDVLRPGIISYGISPSLNLVKTRRELGIRSSVSLKVTPMQVKDVRPGENLGYGSDVTVPDGVNRIAVIPLGYNELPRNIGRYLRFRCETSDGSFTLNPLGKYCMDCSFLEYPFSERKELYALWDGQVEEIAEHTGSAPHEILLRLASSLPKRYRLSAGVDNPKLLKVASSG